MAVDCPADASCSAALPTKPGGTAQRDSGSGEGAREGCQVRCDASARERAR